MYARVTRFQMQIERSEDASRITEQEITPGLRGEPGFKHLYVLVAPESGQGMVVTLWESQAAEVASRPTTGQRFALLGEILTGPPQPSEVYEVMAEG
jgi:hypothetical protein